MTDRMFSKGFRMRRSRLVTGIAVVAAVAAGGVGGALIGVPSLSGAQQLASSAVNVAATGNPPAANATRPAHRSALLEAAAKALNLTPEQLRTKLSDGKTTIADVAKQQNVDVQTVIDAMAAADKERIEGIVNKPWPKFGTGRGPGGPKGPGGPGTPPNAKGAPGFAGGLGGGFGRLGALVFDPVAKALGITTDELKADLAKGQTIAEIAKSKNLDVNKVIDTLVDDASKAIDKAVTDGHLTKAQADKIKPSLKTAITKIVNDGLKGAKGAFGGFGGFGGRHGFGGTKGGPSTTAPSTTVPVAP
jgi:hypothetical protein